MAKLRARYWSSVVVGVTAAVLFYAILVNTYTALQIQSVQHQNTKTNKVQVSELMSLKSLLSKQGSNHLVTDGELGYMTLVIDSLCVATPGCTLPKGILK